MVERNCRAGHHQHDEIQQRTEKNKNGGKEVTLRDY